jgi:hypothetical protein
MRRSNIFFRLKSLILDRLQIADVPEPFSYRVPHSEIDRENTRGRKPAIDQNEGFMKLE